MAEDQGEPGQGVVIAGFTAPRGSRKYFGALVLAVREGNGLRYVGRAGTGFNAETLRTVYEKLAPLITDMKPIPEKVPDAGNTTWVNPELVAEVNSPNGRRRGRCATPCSSACAPTSPPRR